MTILYVDFLEYFIFNDPSFLNKTKITIDLVRYEL